MSSGRVLVYGGKGALGAAIVEHFKARNVWILNVDLMRNDAADANVLVDPTDCWIEQEANVLKSVESILKSSQLDAILCVAGGWAGGNAGSSEFIKNADLVWKQSVWSSAISARVASKFLRSGGLLQLTGAAAAEQGTAGMVGYGMAKAAVHQLTKSLSEKDSGLPADSTVLAILPVTLDTPMNRKWMPKADHSQWTPLAYIASTLYKWTFEENNGTRPKSGALLKLTTKEGETKAEELQQ